MPKPNNAVPVQKVHILNTFSASSFHRLRFTAMTCPSHDSIGTWQPRRRRRRRRRRRISLENSWRKSSTNREVFPLMSHRRQADARSGAYSDPFADPFFGGGLDPISAMMQQQQQMMSNMNQMMGGMGGMFGGLGGMGMMGMAHPMLMNESTPRSRQQQPAPRPARASSGPIVEEPDAEPSAATHYRSGLDMNAPTLPSFRRSRRLYACSPACAPPP
jgi:hypothetical protein